MQRNILRLIFAIILIAFGSLGRILLLDLPNVETLTVASLLAGGVLGGFYALIVPVAVVAITDLYIGNTNILIFTWAAWAIIGLLGMVLRKKEKTSFKFIFSITGLGIGASLFFYLYTNFGVWLLTSLYDKTFSGLLMCYYMGLPFLKYSLTGNLIIVPLVSFIFVGVAKFVSIYFPKLSKVIIAG